MVQGPCAHLGLDHVLTWVYIILAPMRTDQVTETLSLPMASRATNTCISIFSGASLGGVPIRMLLTNCAPRPRLQVLAMCQPLKNNAITMRK
jgi:hypothetical protein